MVDSVHIHLFGSLRQFLPSRVNPICVDCSEPIFLEEVIRRLGIKSSSVQLAMANHRAIGFRELVRPGDRVALFPKEYAVFVDWKDFRT